MADVTTTDYTTNPPTVTQRNFTAQELEQKQLAINELQSIADTYAAKDATKQSAIEKLAALGLTVDEIKEAFGLEAPQ